MRSACLFSLLLIKMKPGVIRIRPIAPAPVAPPPVAPSPADSQAGRCAFLGDVPAGWSEGDVKGIIHSRGYAYPERALIRASTGEKPGFFAMVYFNTPADAERFKKGGLTWPSGVVATTGSVLL